jgi:GT2 family glycosyltransferase
VFGEHRVLIVEAVRSMIASSPDIDFEVVVVADEPLSEAYTKPLREMLGHRLVIVKYDKAFNFSEKSNLGALHASGDMLVFANDDLQIITPQWLEGMVALAEQPDVGLVGAFLRFEDGSVQHAGHIYFDGLAGHAHFKSDPSSGYFGDLVVDHEASGATAALVACRRSVWREVGGFCLGLPDSFNDVDFCLKIRARGYRIVIAMGVEAWHFESKTRDPSVQEWEVSFLQDRWLAATKVERYMRAMG